MGKHAYNFADEKGGGSVAVVAVQKHGDIDIYDVAVFEGPTGCVREVRCERVRNVKYDYSSGTPCAMMLFTLVQQDRGKLE